MDTLKKPGTEITYREYQAGDEQAIISLFNLVFNRNMTTDQWNWAYKENTEQRLDIILAFQGPDLVGQSASNPLRFSFKKAVAKTTRVQNVMVHPDCCGKGIFTATLKKLTEYIYQNNLDLVVTFPNNKSLPTFNGSLTAIVFQTSTHSVYLHHHSFLLLPRILLYRLMTVYSSLKVTVNLCCRA